MPLPSSWLGKHQHPIEVHTSSSVRVPTSSGWSSSAIHKRERSSWGASSHSSEPICTSTGVLRFACTIEGAQARSSQQRGWLTNHGQVRFPSKPVVLASPVGKSRETLHLQCCLQPLLIVLLLPSAQITLQLMGSLCQSTRSRSHACSQRPTVAAGAKRPSKGLHQVAAAAQLW